ncbi:MAG: hypothetical protein AAF891_01795 [Pseudomonadota bacterium]
MKELLRIDVSGSLTVLDKDGQSRLPKGQKTCGVLAILATSPDLKRERKWIRSRLWSDRGADQGNASLRQSLMELRKSFGPMASVLQSDRKHVWLDAQSVKIIMPGDPDTATATGDGFLDGIDVRDEAFESWLRDMRASFSPAPLSVHSPAPISARNDDRVRIVFDPGKTGGDAPFVVSVSGQEIVKYVCERSLATPCDKIDASAAAPPQHLVEVVCDVNCLGTVSQVHLQAIRLSDGMTICSRFGEFPCAAKALLNNKDYRQMIPEFGEQLCLKLPIPHSDDPQRHEVLAQLKDGIAGIFSYDSDRIVAAESKLLKAYESTGNPSILIWLAWQKTTQVIEEATTDKETATELARYYCSKALEAEPHSAFANAMASLVHMIHFDDIEASFMLANRANGLSKFDPYVQAALATANMFAGRPKDAARNSLVGTRLARFTGNAHWWDLSHSLACLSNGDLVGSEEYALRASRAAPKFRAPKRVLLALYASQKRVESAVDQMHALKDAEPTFSIDRFLKDPDYPNTTIRNAGLLDYLARLDQ